MVAGVALAVVVVAFAVGIGLSRRRRPPAPTDMRRADDAQRAPVDGSTARDAAFRAIDRFHPLP